MPFTLATLSRTLFFSLILSLTISYAFAQTTEGLKVHGRIIFEDGSAGYSLVKIYNQRAGTNISPASNGFFDLHGYKTDTFLFICKNYSPVELCYKDSVTKWSYDITVYMRHIEVEMNMLVITPDKTYDEIQNEIDSLGVKNTDTYKNVNAYQSPITALWEMYSKTERQKREIAILMNDDQRRATLKELLKLCVKTNLIDLSFYDFDAFIDFCGYTDEYLQQTSFYDLLSSIKQHYRYFRR